MTKFKIFIQNNIEYIIVVVVLFISLLTLFSVLGVDFNSHRHDHIDKIVTVEAFINEISEDATVPSNVNKEEDVSQDQDSGADSGDIDNTGDVPLMDDSEETGNPIRVSFSKKQKAKEEHKSYKQRRILELLKEKHGSIQKTLGDNHLHSNCHPVYSTSHSIEEHCNTMNDIQDKCKINPCCVLLPKDNKCVAGNKDGPTFLAKDGNYVDNSHYYHKGDCYGKSCKE
tara:strand:+ start:69 stop:749 length:681 start_codon:yes stop_codon:yes gene_type:complete